MFARNPIKRGEVVIVWGGILLTKEAVQGGKYKRGSLSAIDEDLWLGDVPGGDDDDTANYTNHSCDPNLWMKDEVSLMARRDIGAGEELTADYALWEVDEGFKARWECQCGMRNCRGRVMGSDWRLEELQGRYEKHFSPFLNQRIEKAK
jgi:uncharacterized protein